MSCFWLQHHCTQSWLIHILIQSYQSFHLILCDSLICTQMFKIWRQFPSAIWPSWKERQWSSAHGIWRCGREFQKYHPRILQPWRITKSPLVQFEAYMWFAESFKDPLKLVLNFCMCNCATALHIINQWSLALQCPPQEQTGRFGNSQPQTRPSSGALQHMGQYRVSLAFALTTKLEMYLSNRNRKPGISR